MAIDITTRGAARINPVVECGGAQIRAHYRHLATVITVRGGIDATNVDQLSEHARRFVLASEALVLDLSGVTSFAAAGIWLLCVLDGDCRAAGVEWTLIESASVHDLLGDFDEDAMFPTSPLVDQALHALADGNDQRRQALLPLFEKSA
ncbi:STAS domain-containing protein [Mycolicibacter hiberniae]|uniref:Sulfate transporter n=1 Tax=Mycolicibacter hiberniae TaxID=29314 RepID=A0A7I7X178_9MYCO|nr:STAS domain-containing protein [Mycolicibacter hiberniae]MCV7085374.1 STAS domain-containing protein [Mycolicibacter hiberniae]ORV70304.1 sulfate transporter [Mycolicibacter hiberniae]BBZ23050.1 sulfate transporter [Mycolicibacter hiberniae]